MRDPLRPVEPWSHIVRLEGVGRASESFVLAPEPEVRTALAERMAILGLRKLRFAGRLEPEGKRDWRLVAELGATAVQACVVTFAPVTTRIDETVERRYLAELPEIPGEDEIEMPDETVEPLPAALDIGGVLAEALAIALPDWPRADGAELERSAFPGLETQPITDEDTLPFAGLKDMIGKRDNDPEER